MHNNKNSNSECLSLGFGFRLRTWTRHIPSHRTSSFHSWESEHGRTGFLLGLRAMKGIFSAKLDCLLLKNFFAEKQNESRLVRRIHRAIVKSSLLGIKCSWWHFCLSTKTWDELEIKLATTETGSHFLSFEPWPGFTNVFTIFSN